MIKNKHFLFIFFVHYSFTLFAQLNPKSLVNKDILIFKSDIINIETINNKSGGITHNTTGDIIIISASEEKIKNIQNQLEVLKNQGKKRDDQIQKQKKIISVLSVKQENILNVQKKFKITLESLKKKIIDLDKKDEVKQKLIAEVKDVELGFKSIESLISNNIPIITLKEESTGYISYGINQNYLTSNQSFIEIDSYSGELARIRKNNKYGFINTKGDIVIDFKYDYAKSFKFGYSVTKNNEEYTIIDLNGKKIISFEKSNAQNVTILSENLVLVEGDGYYDNSIHFLNKKNEIKFVLSISDFDENGLASINVLRKYGMIDTKGNYIIEPLYSRKIDFNIYNTAVVSKRRSGWKILINNEGTALTQNSYSKIDNFNTFGIAKVYGNRTINTKEGVTEHTDYETSEGIIDTTGFETVPLFKYKTISDFNKFGYAFVENSMLKVGVINYKGQSIIPCIYERLVWFNKEKGILKGKKSRDYGFGLIGINGEVLLDFEYKDIKPYNLFGVAKIIYYGGYIGLINKQYEVITSEKNENLTNYISSFDKNGYAIIANEYGSKYGLIDTLGKIIVPKILDSILPFSKKNIAITMCKNSKNSVLKYGFIKNKEIIIDCKYDLIKPFIKTLTIIGNYKKSATSNSIKYGLINSTGLEIAPPIFEKIQEFNNKYVIYHKNKINFIEVSR